MMTLMPIERSSMSKEYLDSEKCTANLKNLCSFHYKGFHIIWSGWKIDSDCSFAVCQWYAWPVVYKDNIRDDVMVYASYPGKQGTYKLGEVFDISPVEGQEPVQAWGDFPVQSRDRSIQSDNSGKYYYPQDKLQKLVAHSNDALTRLLLEIDRYRS